MSARCVAVALKVPDNTAFTALVALQRLGVPVGRVERARIVRIEGADDAAIRERVSADESLFNPNLHSIEIRKSNAPLAGELWVQADDDTVSWHLFDEQGRPVERTVLERARDALLCNAAFESAALPA